MLSNLALILRWGFIFQIKSISSQVNLKEQVASILICEEINYLDVYIKKFRGLMGVSKT